MATVDMTRGAGTGGLAGPSAYNRIFCVEKKIDASASNRAASDVLQIFNVYAGMIILGGWINVITAEDSTSTGTIGDGADPDGWLTTVNFENTGFTIWDGALIGVESVGYMYASADTIDITLSANAQNTAVYNVGIFGVDTSDRANLGTN